MIIRYLRQQAKDNRVRLTWNSKRSIEYFPTDRRQEREDTSLVIGQRLLGVVLTCIFYQADLTMVFAIINIMLLIQTNVTVHGLDETDKSIIIQC